MNRRKAIKQFGLLSGGLILLPSCNLSEENVARVMNKFEVTESQDKIMKELVNSVLPESEIPGALTLKVDEFVWVMADDCLDKNTQTSFLNGLKAFDQQVKKLAGHHFSDLSEEAKVSVLSSLEGDGSDNAEVQTFVTTTKKFTILGYMNSEYIMKEVMPYPLIPGKNPSCETVEPGQKINVNA